MQLIDLGTIDYNEALSQQLDWLKKVQSNSSEAIVLACTHPPVVTLGRSTQANDVMGWQGAVVEVSRGGRATYHGPGQIVLYPIVNLNEPPFGVKAKDINSYLRFLESTIIDTLKAFGVAAEVKDTVQYDEQGKKISFTGVWVGEKKIASIGIAIKKWTTFHGVAVNLWDDPEAFKGINPCGFSTDVMTSLSSLLGKEISRLEFLEQYKKTLHG